MVQGVYEIIRHSRGLAPARSGTPSKYCFDGNPSTRRSFDRARRRPRAGLHHGLGGGKGGNAGGNGDRTDHRGLARRAPLHHDPGRLEVDDIDLCIGRKPGAPDGIGLNVPRRPPDPMRMRVT